MQHLFELSYVGFQKTYSGRQTRGNLLAAHDASQPSTFLDPSFSTPFFDPSFSTPFLGVGPTNGVSTGFSA